MLLQKRLTIAAIVWNDVILIVTGKLQNTPGCYYFFLSTLQSIERTWIWDLDQITI